jgi:uncharacterized protein (TIGR03435 family)
VIPVSLLWGQAAFEVASVKQASAGWTSPFYIMKGGGIETNDPGQFTATAVPLLRLILRAYERIPSQVASSRSLEADRYDIVAKVPHGATNAQVNVMLRNLLVERIGLVVHLTTRPGPLYEMVVARSGLKMKQAEPAPSGSAAGDSPDARRDGLPPGVSIGKDDTVELAPGRSNWTIYAIDESTMRITARMQSLPQLIRLMERETGRTVRDKTGLTGKYDFDFTFARATGPPPGPDVSPTEPAVTASDPVGDFLAAVASHLGLRLVPKKGPVEVLVVDKWNKVPVGN